MSVNRIGKSDRLIVRSEEPPVFELPYHEYLEVYTPTELFFVRSHFPTPTLDPASWRLRVEGAVEKPFELSLEQILALPSVTVGATLECAGNGRSFLDPPVSGVQWNTGGVSCASWTGPRLSEVLDLAGINAAAVEIILEGADRGMIAEFGPPEPITFARSLPLSKALQPDVILAHSMNGEPLPIAHGYPLRVVVPGWYAVASVKWLARIIATEEPFMGYYQTIDYSTWSENHGVTSLKTLTEVRVKAQISRPLPDEKVAAGSCYGIRGAAWGGASPVEAVEVTFDEGESWNEAALLGPALPYTWRLWQFDWRTPPEPGPAVVMARARDAAGNVQPMDRPAGRNGYMIDHVQRIGLQLV